MSAEPLLSLERVSAVIAGRPVLDEVTLTVRRGAIVTVIGPNGAGKSTLLKIALGLVEPSAGTLRQLAGLRVGYMPQRLHVPGALPLTVERFLRLGGAEPRVVANALAEVELSDLAKQPLQSVSGGEMQRILLARALLRAPDLLVLDEPVQGVDVTGQTAMYELIADLRRRHDCGVLMVSHDLHWVMAKTDHVLCLNQHVCCQGHPQQVGADPAYRSLFGPQVAHALAPYLHQHDHDHDLHGHVVQPMPPGAGSCSS